MKDLRLHLEHDIEKLSDTMMGGGLAVDAAGTPLSERLSPAEMHHLAGEVIEYLLEHTPISALIRALDSMAYITLSEACLRARCSRNTILNWIKDGKIIGVHPGGEEGNNWLVVRESLDAHILKEHHDRMTVRMSAGKGG